MNLLVEIKSQTSVRNTIGTVKDVMGIKLTGSRSFDDAELASLTDLVESTGVSSILSHSFSKGEFGAPSPGALGRGAAVSA
jgi:hypothetical protein